MPEDLKSEDLQDLIAWLGELVRQVDSSLLDEWEQLANPEEETAEEAAERADQVKPVTANARAFRVLVRNAMFRRVELAALEKYDELAELDADAGWDADAWADAHGRLLGRVRRPRHRPGRARPEAAAIEEEPEHGLWRVRQVFADPDGDHDWGISAEVGPGRLRRGGPRGDPAHRRRRAVRRGRRPQPGRTPRRAADAA